MPVPEPSPLGRLVRRLRLRAALSQEELAARSGVSARAISDLERGQRRTARFETVRMLADGLELSPEDRAQLTQTAQAPLIEITLRPPLAAPRSGRPLPSSATPLVGREREVAEVVNELVAGRARLVTLTGAGGVGKTRLAQAVASEVAARFPGGVGWVDLAPVPDPGAVVAAIADGLGVVEGPPQPGIDALRRHLASRPFLLVLDNFERVVEAASAVSDLLAAVPSLTVLVTSRTPLRVSAEVAYPVGPLSLPASDAATQEIQSAEAVRLFVERARAVRRDFVLTPENGEAVARICRRLDGLPLAIELAAARANVLPPPMLLERLEPRLPLLTRGPRDAPRRQQTMADAIAWSYDLLDPDARWLFRRLSVFVGGFTLDTVEWLAAAHRMGGTGALDALATLADNSLVVRAADAEDGARFTLFETIREYGIARLVEREELREAHGLLAGYCRSVARHGDGIPNCIVPEPWVAMVDRERANIRAAYHLLATANDRERAFEFATAFGHYLYNRGPLDEAWSWFGSLLDAPSSQPTIRLQGLYWASHLSLHLGMTETAGRLATEALAVAERLGDTGWRASIVHCLALVRMNLGEPEQAEALFDEELRLWEQAGVRGLSGFALMLLGVLAFERGDLPRAHALEDRADEILAAMGGTGWLAMTRWFRGRFASAGGHHSAAAAHFADSVRFAHDQKATLLEHLGLVGLASVAADAALPETAARLIGAADASLERTGQPLSGSAKDLYDRSTSASRSAIGGAAFAAARESGSASDRDEWLRLGEAVRRAAAKPDRGHGPSGRRTDPKPGQAFSPHAAAD